jgi:hypothetical protein
MKPGMFKSIKDFILWCIMIGAISVAFYLILYAIAKETGLFDYFYNIVQDVLIWMLGGK